ncbi:hypothetical protein ACFL15_02620 [Patescibacteria group bacterium]
MIGFLKFWIKNIFIALGVLTIAFSAGLAFNYSPLSKENKTSSPTPTVTPTSKPTKTPISVPKVTSNPDPIVDCGPGVNSGQYVKDKASNCKNYVDCGLNNNTVWTMMLKSECEQKQANENNGKSNSTIKCELSYGTYYLSEELCNQYKANQVGGYPPCTIYYPNTKTTETYTIFSPEECKQKQDFWAGMVLDIQTITPIPTPTIDPNRDVEIQQCKDNAKTKYDREYDDLRNYYRALGALSSSAYATAVKDLQDDYQYWLYLCENAY